MPTPDNWCIVKLKLEDKSILYKVFSTYYGGYLSGDSWLLNSGITKYDVVENKYLFHGESGSIYTCYMDNEGVSFYGDSVLKTLKQDKENPP